MKFFIIPFFLISQILTSCTPLTLNMKGFQAAILVNASGYKLDTVNKAKMELTAYIESLGFEKSNPSPHHVEQPNYIKYRSPNHNVVFYNLYLDNPEKIEITIRDAQRAYRSSKELREEIEELLTILRKYFDNDRIKYEQQSTFLS